MLKLGVLLSGYGSNLQNIINACVGDFPARVAVVISNKPDAYGLERARKAGIPALTVNHKDFPDRESFDRVMHQHLQEQGVELLCLAGFMRLLSPWMVTQWHNRAINIHPALLPSFKGADGVGDALAAGVKIAGCTLHYLRAEMDTGPIIAQHAVPVFHDDTKETLAARILEGEHLCYRQGIQLIAEGRVRVENERAIVQGRHFSGALLNPQV